jgi:hypothetical protein
MLAVFFQEGQEVIADLHVEINGDLRCPKHPKHPSTINTYLGTLPCPYLIEQEDIPRLHETHAQLHAPPLTVRDGVHVPVEVHIENIKQTITAFLVAIPTY